MSVRLEDLYRQAYLTEGSQRHALLAQAAALRKSRAAVAASGPPELVAVMGMFGVATLVWALFGQAGQPGVGAAVAIVVFIGGLITLWRRSRRRR